VRLEQLLARRVAHVPVAAQQRLGEVLLQHPDHGSVSIEYLMAATELEHRLGLDHEQVITVIGREAEADILLDLHLLLLHIEQRPALLFRAGSGDADPVFVRDRLEDLLDEQPVRSLELAQNGRCFRDGGSHRSES
jgi:hypothetical protein